jgi:serine-type D-Ala-D-Ala carboxypeptidase (penicillin-binding protein 5/6)
MKLSVRRHAERGGSAGCRLAIAAFLAVAAITLVTAGAALARRRPVSRHPAPDAPSKLTEPYVAACVMEPATGRILFEKNMHEPWPTASLAKMMLMLIAAEKLHDGSLKLSDPITTSRKAAAMGGSQVYLKQGETFPLEDMMKAIVVHSANDASVAVAEYIAGSSDAFVQLMNREAAQLGMKDTHYYTVHGLPPAPGQKADVSSAYDSAILARELVKYPLILKWAAIDQTTFRHGTFNLRNTNHLVRDYPGCDGLKTGFYDQAGFNVVATAHRNGMRLIAVVLGSPRKRQNFDQAATMLSQGFAGYRMYKVAKKGSEATQAVTVSGAVIQRLKPVFASDITLLVKRDDSKKDVKLSYRMPESVAAPIKAGQQIGVAEAIVDGKPAASAALIAPGSIAKASLWQRFWNRL